MDNKLNPYKKISNRTTKYTKTLDNNNKTIHSYEVHIVTDYHFSISEPTVRKICIFIGLVLGVIIHELYIQNIEIISKYVQSLKEVLFYLTPFARKIISNENFRYVFSVGIVLTIIVSILFFITMWIESEKLVTTIIVSIFFSFIYLYLNFGICHLIIKIPVYFSILSVIAIIISNIITGFICWIIELFILDS